MTESNGKSDGRGFVPLLPVVVLAALLLASCAAPLPIKRTFVDQGEQPEAAVPAGLNPLGALETCPEIATGARQGAWVLVSRPEFFTREASQMILSLREALAVAAQGRSAVEMFLSGKPLHSVEQARREGLRCGALVVLWERQGTQTLELTLPAPDRIPLRAIMHKQLCEFGNHAEQATILHHTIRGLSALADEDFQTADFFLTAANRIDIQCLRLPLVDSGKSG